MGLARWELACGTMGWIASFCIVKTGKHLLWEGSNLIDHCTKPGSSFDSINQLDWLRNNILETQKRQERCYVQIPAGTHFNESNAWDGMVKHSISTPKQLVNCSNDPAWIKEHGRLQHRCTTVRLQMLKRYNPFSNINLANGFAHIPDIRESPSWKIRQVAGSADRGLHRMHL